MPKRDVDKRKTRKALRKLKRVATAVEEGEAKLSDWEKDFVSGVTTRLEKYGSAFRDPSKGRLEEALSQRQTQIARVLDRKSRPKKAAAPAEDAKPGPPKPRSTFKRKDPPRRTNARDINADLAEDAAPASPEARRSRIRLVPRDKP